MKERGSIKKNKAQTTLGKDWIPIGPYRHTHPKARLTDEQRELLVNWLNPTD